MEPKISAIVALGRGTRAICDGNNLLWTIPDDHKRLRQLTNGHVLVMGRKTYESIGHPLRGRANIIVTRNADYKADVPSDYANEYVLVVDSPEKGIEQALRLEEEKNRENQEVFIFGGGEIYAQTLSKVNKLYLTLVDSDKEGTSVFPEYEKEFTKKTFEESHEWNGINYTWVDLER